MAAASSSPEPAEKREPSAEGRNEEAAAPTASTPPRQPPLQSPRAFEELRRNEYLLSQVATPDLVRTFSRSLQQLEQRLAQSETALHTQSSRLAELSAAGAAAAGLQATVEETRQRLETAEKNLCVTNEQNELLLAEQQHLTALLVKEREQRQERDAEQVGMLRELSARLEGVVNEDLQSVNSGFGTVQNWWEKRFLDEKGELQDELRKLEFRQLRLEDDVFRQQNATLLERADNKEITDQVQRLRERLDEVEDTRAFGSDVALKERRLKEAIYELGQSQGVLEKSLKLVVDDAKILIRESSDYVLDGYREFRGEFEKKWQDVQETKSAVLERVEQAEQELQNFLAQVDDIAVQTVEEARECVEELRVELEYAEQKRLKDRNTFEKKIQEALQSKFSIYKNLLSGSGPGAGGGGDAGMLSSASPGVGRIASTRGGKQGLGAGARETAYGIAVVAEFDGGENRFSENLDGDVGHVGESREDKGRDENLGAEQELGGGGRATFVPTRPTGILSDYALESIGGPPSSASHLFTGSAGKIVFPRSGGKTVVLHAGDKNDSSNFTRRGGGAGEATTPGGNATSKSAAVSGEEGQPMANLLGSASFYLGGGGGGSGKKSVAVKSGDRDVGSVGGDPRISSFNPSPVRRVRESTAVGRRTEIGTQK